MKTCSKCGVPKHLEDFGSDASKKDGLTNWCRKCLADLRKKNFDYHKQRNKKWALDNPEKVEAGAKRKKLKKYGLTPEAYEQMVQDQHGCCKICCQVMAPVYIDHSHVTGKVRALLCLQCNTAIGSLKDSPELCVKASEYLKSFL